MFRDWIARQPKTPAEKGKDDAVRYVTIVFVMVNGEARARPVQTGISDQERIEILEGSGPEDDVIVGPFRVLDEMEEGQPVKLEEPKKTGKERPSHPRPEKASGVAEPTRADCPASAVASQTRPPDGTSAGAMRPAKEQP